MKEPEVRQNEAVDIAFVRKNRNWSRKHKRQKGLLNPWKWGYASRSRGTRSSGTQVKVDDIRQRLMGR